MEQIINAIKSHEKFVIMSHKSPDGDSIGSCIALGLALKRLGKSITYIMDETPEKFDYLADIDQFQSDTSEHYQVALCLDCSNRDYLHNNKILSHCDLVVCIDHHVSNTYFGDLNHVNTQASATGELVYELIDKLHIAIETDMAISLYTAIVTDTGRFKYSNVSSETHRIVSELYKITDEYWEINTIIFDQNSFDDMKILGIALENLTLTHDNKISVITLSQREIKGYEDAELDGIVNYTRDIKGVEVGLFIREVEEGEFRISLRANTDYDVSKLAEQYGGGGHSKAAGCTIKGTSVKEIADDITRKIAKDL